MDVVFGVSPEEITNAHVEMDSFFSLMDCRPNPGSQKSIQELKKYFEIVMLTARDKRYQKVTKQWISKYFGEQKIIFGSGTNLIYSLDKNETKISFCKKLKIDFMIEDNPYEIEELLKTKTEPICYGWEANVKYQNDPRVFRGDWAQITNYLLGKIS